MPNPKTTILCPHSKVETAAAVERLTTDLSVGGIALNGFITGEQIDDLLITEGSGFSTLDPFKDLFSIISETLIGERDRYEIFELGRFMHSHPWHLAEHNPEDASLRVWLHLRGQVRFWLARAVHTGIQPAFDCTTEEVVADVSASPVYIEPFPGDALIFVDRGCREKTGPSTYHRVDVISDTSERVSIACDINLK